MTIATTDAPLLLRVPEVCELLALGRSTVYVLMTAGDLETVHIGRSVRVTAESAHSFVERNRSGDAHNPG